MANRRPVSTWIEIIFLGFLALIILSSLGAMALGMYGTFHNQSFESCHVTDKDRTTNPESGSSDMRVYTDNCGVFVVRDNFLKGRGDAADDYSQIDVGKTYDFETTGFRIRLLSTFPNIIEAKEIS